MVNPGLDEIMRTSFQYDFGYEHKIAREYGLGDSHGREDTSAHGSSASSKDSSSLQVDTGTLPSSTLWDSLFIACRVLAQSARRPVSPTICLSKRNARGLRTTVMTACSVSCPSRAHSATCSGPWPGTSGRACRGHVVCCRWRTHGRLSS